MIKKLYEKDFDDFIKQFDENEEQIIGFKYSHGLKGVAISNIGSFKIGKRRFFQKENDYIEVIY